MAAKLPVEDTFINTAVFNGKCYHHFGIHEITAGIFGDKVSDIMDVTLRISKDQSKPKKEITAQTDADYWGWYDSNRGEFSHTMIFPQRFLLALCFPGGIELAELAEHGRAYRLEIVKAERRIINQNQKQ